MYKKMKLNIINVTLSKCVNYFTVIVMIIIIIIIIIIIMSVTVLHSTECSNMLHCSSAHASRWQDAFAAVGCKRL
jgi:amino acid transporter